MQGIIENKFPYVFTQNLNQPWLYYIPHLLRIQTFNTVIRIDVLYQIGFLAR
jgi:hypothetical protein